MVVNMSTIFSSVSLSVHLLDVFFTQNIKERVSPKQWQTLSNQFINLISFLFTQNLKPSLKGWDSHSWNPFYSFSFCLSCSASAIFKCIHCKITILCIIILLTCHYYFYSMATIRHACFLEQFFLPFYIFGI